MTSFTLPIPTYQCHKRVQALKIKAVIENPRGYELHFEDERFCPVEFACNGVAFYPEAGRYLVLADGKPPICMDAAAFEAGYTLVEEVSTQPRKSLIASTPEGGAASVFIQGDDGSVEFKIDGLTKAQADAVHDLCLVWELHNVGCSSIVGPATQAALEVGK